MSRRTQLLSKFRKWARSVLERTDRRGSDDQIKPFLLPAELIIEVALIAGRSSQKTYRSLLCVSRQLNSIMEKECLPELPVRLESSSQIINFHRMIVLRPELAFRVKHLWMRGSRSRQKPKVGYSEPTPGTWRQFKASAFEQLHIINACSNLVSLACSFPVMFLSFRFTKDIFFKHDHLKELTLFENWNLWSCFAVEPPIDGPHLFLQLTHLTILDSVAPHFPIDLFTSLRFLAAEFHPHSRQNALEAFRAPSTLKGALPVDLRALSGDVKVTLHMVHNVELGVRKVAWEGHRDWEMRVGAPRYFDWWSQRVSGGSGVWSSQ